MFRKRIPALGWVAFCGVALVFAATCGPAENGVAQDPADAGDVQGSDGAEAPPPGLDAALAGLDAQVEAELDASSEPEPDAGSPTELDSGLTAEPDAGAAAEPDSGPSREPDAGGMTQPDAGSAAEPDAGSVTESDAGEATEPDGGETTEPDAGSLPYADIEHLRNDALKVALYDRVKDHTGVGYDPGAKRALFSANGIDVRDGKVECIYTGQLFDYTMLDKTGGYNTEHSWPKSDGAKTEPAQGDLHHLFPSERDVNSGRSSYPFGETDCLTNCRTYPGGSQRGPTVGGSTIVFEVRPERRGEIARAHFYFSIRYRLSIPYSEETVLKRWNRDDPPDDAERARNIAIEAVQKKRNPFIERPDFADFISDF